MTRQVKLVAFMALVPFLASMFLLGVGLRYGILVEFAVGWPLFQIFGYTITYNMAKGDITNPLFKTQVGLHWIMLALLGAIVARVT